VIILAFVQWYLELVLFYRGKKQVGGREGIGLTLVDANEFLHDFFVAGVNFLLFFNFMVLLGFVQLGGGRVQTVMLGHSWVLALNALAVELVCSKYQPGYLSC